MTNNISNFQRVTKHNPCIHCEKPDWCYQIGVLTVCKRKVEPADGWKTTSKKDSEGTYYYAPIQEKSQKTIRPSQTRIWEYPDRNGKPFVRVVRVDDGKGKKKIWQENWDGSKWVKGLKNIKREDIPIYRYQEIKIAIEQGKTIFIAEGEPSADALWNIGIPATTNIAGSGKWKPSDTEDLSGAKVVLCPDRDKPGLKHMELVATDFPDALWLYAFPTSPFWHNLPDSSGADVADWIVDYNLTEENEIWEAIEPRRQDLFNPPTPTSPPEEPVIEENYVQKCLSALYSDESWMATGGKLYKWTGTHYQPVSAGAEKRRIARWCNTTPTKVGRSWKYKYATATHVENIWKWLHQYFYVAPEEINPPGINCLNGVIKINWNGSIASWELVPHNPEIIYTYVSEFNFDPNADPTDCDRMLSCLEPKQQKLFIQTIAASLDLDTIRRLRGRVVKSLLCKGHGNNGKDTLREAVRLLYGGIGMSHATVSDFAAYDRSRKFSLAKLEGTRINWSSENSSFNNLDSLESLKAAITGEPLDMERKGVDERSMMLSTVFLFNVNEAPNLKAGLEAIQSRWAVLSFNKTYKANADPNKSELEADSRFRYDPNFLREKVCPALLNKMLAEIATLAVDGIDYSCTEEALYEIQKETNHLWEFAQDLGLEYRVGGKVYINDLWEILQEWYVNNGTLEIVSNDGGKDKKIWHERSRRGDKNVKAPNQVFQRFAELFPKIKRGVENGHHPTHPKQSYLTGISIREVSSGSQWEGNGEASGEGKNNGVSRVGSQGSQFSNIGEILDRIGVDAFVAGLQPNQLILLQKQLAQLASQAVTERVTSSKTSEPIFDDNNLASSQPEAIQLASQPCPEQITSSEVQESILANKKLNSRQTEMTKLASQSVPTRVTSSQNHSKKSNNNFLDESKKVKK
jgi:phage/plasmid-associated DNA primase